MKQSQKLQFLEWPLEAGSRSELIPTDTHVEKANFTAEKKTCLRPGAHAHTHTHTHKNTIGNFHVMTTV